MYSDRPAHREEGSRRAEPAREVMSPLPRASPKLGVGKHVSVVDSERGLPSVWRSMARGWESKSIESQQDEAARERDVRRRRPLTQAERLRLERRRTLELARLRLLADLQAATRAPHRDTLGKALAALDQELATLTTEGVREP